ncbi:MAG: hypothetical protein ABJK59_13565 [Erythrobacter sp.]|uniref:hypothetical protein n=1 Tax=Erythrobacter sp. TaxID=1042 RepID=UPI00329A4263
MTDDNDPLSTNEHVSQQYEQMRPLVGLLGLFSRDIKHRAKDLDEQFAALKRIKENSQEFAERFGPLGWTVYDRLSVDAVRDAVTEADDQLAEESLVLHHLSSDNLKHLGYRFNTSAFRAWQELFQRAVERLSSEDYISAVPLILIVIDGICTTKSGKHPFSGGADAPVFDTETTGPGGISDGLAILGKTRRKLDTEAIDCPYRHGIVHGLNPNFGNAFVAAKAVNLLQTMIDYFERKEDEEERIAKAAEDQRQPSWTELANTMSKTQETKRRINEWEARPEVSGVCLASRDESHEFADDSPETTATIYLNAILSRNFGELAKLTIDYPNRSIGYRAGNLRETLGEIELTHWVVTAIRDNAPAISEVDVEV